MTNSEKALEFVKPGCVIGLGTGAASVAFIHALGKAVQGGLKVTGVPTSVKSAALAERLAIPLATLEEVNATLDVAVDGADEVDRHMNLIKGLGGALVREKIVAASAKQFIVLIGPDKVEQKDTGTLGTRGVLPVEVVQFGLALVRRELTALKLDPQLRQVEAGGAFISDNGNFILDCKLQPLTDPAAFEQQLRAIPGVVDTGLFLNMAHAVLIQRGDELEVRQR